MKYYFKIKVMDNNLLQPIFKFLYKDLRCKVKQEKYTEIK